MTLESNIVNEIKFLQFNDEKARNAISAEDWINLQEEIESFEKDFSDTFKSKQRTAKKHFFIKA